MTPWRLAVRRGTGCRDLRGFGAMERKTGGGAGWHTQRPSHRLAELHSQHPSGKITHVVASLALAGACSGECRWSTGVTEWGASAPHVQYLTARQQGVNDGLERHDIIAAFGNACNCQSLACAKRIRTGSTCPSPAVTGAPEASGITFFTPENRREAIHYPSAPPPSRIFEKKRAPGKHPGLCFLRSPLPTAPLLHERKD